MRKPKSPAGRACPQEHGRQGRGAVSLKIISGGQTGADRAALDFALTYGIPHGGWCSKGRRAEDGKISQRYRLRESASPAYRQRTRLNVEEAEVTVIVGNRPLLGGTALTEQICKRKQKPVLVLSPVLGLSRAAGQLRWFLRATHAQTMNVAGPRASADPFIYQFTFALLQRTFMHQKPAQNKPAIPSRPH